MKKLLVAGLLAALPAAVLADHETPLVGEVQETRYGFALNGHLLAGCDARSYVGKRVQIVGQLEGFCRRSRMRIFRVRTIHHVAPPPQPVICDQLLVHGTIVNRPLGRVFSGYAPAGSTFDPSCFRGVSEVCGNTFRVTLRPGADDPIGTRYAVVVWSECGRRIWDGCKWVNFPRSAGAGPYGFACGRWTSGGRVLAAEDCVTVTFR